MSTNPDREGPLLEPKRINQTVIVPEFHLQGVPGSFSLLLNTGNYWELPGGEITEDKETQLAISNQMFQIYLRNTVYNDAPNKPENPEQFLQDLRKVNRYENDWRKRWAQFEAKRHLFVGTGIELPEEDFLELPQGRESTGYDLPETAVSKQTGSLPITTKPNFFLLQNFAQELPQISLSPSHTDYRYLYFPAWHETKHRDQYRSMRPPQQWHTVTDEAGNEQKIIFVTPDSGNKKVVSFAEPAKGRPMAVSNLSHHALLAHLAASFSDRLP